MAFHLPLQQMTEAIRIVAHAAQVYPDPLIRVTRCLEWLSQHLNGIGSTLTLLKQPNGPGSVVLERMVDIGVWGPVERAARDAYFKNPDHTTDPFAAAFCQRDFLAGATAAIREDCMTDADWYASPHVIDFRKRAEMDSAIYAVVPSMSRNPSDPRLFGLSLNRRWGESPFLPAERDFALGFFSGIEPYLAEIWIDQGVAGQSALDQLPLRQRRVFACLLAGKTEREVAEELMLSPQTVHTYVKHIYRHFGVNSRGQLIAKMANSGPPSGA